MDRRSPWRWPMGEGDGTPVGGVDWKKSGRGGLGKRKYEACSEAFSPVSEVESVAVDQQQVHDD